MIQDLKVHRDVETGLVKIVVTCDEASSELITKFVTQMMNVSQGTDAVFQGLHKISEALKNSKA